MKSINFKNQHEHWQISKCGVAKDRYFINPM